MTILAHETPTPEATTCAYVLAGIVGGACVLVGAFRLYRLLVTDKQRFPLYTPAKRAPAAEPIGV